MTIAIYKFRKYTDRISMASLITNIILNKDRV